MDNIRVEQDLSRVLNYNCFLQYNIGKENEFCPLNWKVPCMYASFCSSLTYCRLMFHFIITQHPKDVSCMLKISVGVLLLVILKNQMPLSMRVHYLIFQMFSNIRAVMLPGMLFY